jgi:hypothetical protein
MRSFSIMALEAQKIYGIKQQKERALGKGEISGYLDIDFEPEAPKRRRQTYLVVKRHSSKR